MDIEIRNDILKIRTSLINSFVTVFTIIAFPALLASLNRIDQLGWLPIMYVHITLMALLLCLAYFRHKIPYGLKASCILFILAAIGLFGIYQFGLMTGGIVALVIIGPLATLFFGLRVGIVILLLIMVGESIIGSLIVSGNLILNFDIMAYSIAPSSWILAVVATGFFASSTSVSINTFNHKLIESLQESRKHQRNLQEYQLALEKTITARTQELQQSNEDLEHFARIAAHDMKSPLNTISGHAQLLAMTYKGKLDREADNSIEEIVEGIHYVSSMINDLLNYSRINNDKDKPGDSDLNTILEHAKYNLSIEIKQGAVIISQDKLPNVNIVETQMTRVLQNILSNSIKYRDKDRPLEIHISAKQNGDKWKISISDNGMGIEANQVERIFEIFHQVDEQANSESSGIGLATCKKIIELHGGKIWVDSTPGKGSTFYFTVAKATAGLTTQQTTGVPQF